MTTPSVLVCLAPGTEEMEAVTVIDIMVRAGFNVTTASAEENGELTLTCSRGVKLMADVPLVKVADEEFDCIVLPGGVEGATHLGESALVVEMIRQQQCDQKWVAAICAAPALVLEKNGLYPEAHKTCHPAFIDHIAEDKKNTRRVFTEHDHKLITSQGPGTALEFAVEIVYMLAGKEKAKEVVDPMVAIPSLHYDKKFA
ncbi:DJ-1 family glyoxalase III [Enterovibrio nigricans]|uniref:4-methyl-5(B-hydroxyethyl)-thiazole monophosphate biosynthesis n=1 Tax=Enterovibrio nigricans DSM 22720 TaxID=1121868 RepID=A0A1T4U3A2_9GAMM|nr:DJ-1 family glyoxalase III [Enterovibrio nigricans]SKA47090.1 4-methyl-5(b-hydroxyethyl)-thiazole monophosphate biosynthesis [Enterovibrio nigricans DSM 22720]